MASWTFAGRAVRRKDALAASGALLLAGGLAAGAIIYPGFATADVDLNDGSVWVTNRSANMVGHLNDQSKVIDGGFTATSTNFDVLQQGNSVLMNNQEGTLLSPVDTSMMLLASETILGGARQTSLGGSTAAVTDAGTGKVWAFPAGSAGSFNEKTAQPIAVGLETPVTVVAPDGTVHSADAKSGEIVSTTIDDGGKVTSQRRVAVPGLAGLADVQLSTAGGKPFAFSPAGGKLFLPEGRTVDVPNAGGARLAQPSESGDAAVLATATGLWAAPMDGSPVRTIDLGDTGTASAPVLQGGCVHAAWGGANKYMLACNGSGTAVDIPKATSQSELVFRQNRDVVVLNDVQGGNVWLVNQQMLLVNNSDDLKADLHKADNAEEDSADPNVVNTLPDRTKPNRPPAAVADEFGVRAGKTTILPVLFNDSDPDGDVLTVETPAGDPSVGTLQQIYGGTGLQVKVPVNASGGGAFEYTAQDGRGGSGKARVQLRVVPETENNPPKAMRDSVMVVEQGQSMSQNILADWIDPDGDEIFLTGAVPEDGSAVVKTRPDGELRYTDDGEASGIKTVKVSVSDGLAVTERDIKVNVRPSGGVPPVANADFFRAATGEPVVLAPLKNDQDPAGGKLRLASVSKSPNATISGIADNGTVTFTSEVPGPVYLEYQVTNGPMSATSLIRVDVVDKTDQGPPVAVKDLALLPAGGTALLDVLGNDLDPSGGVLVLQSVNTPAGSPISAVIVDRHLVKLTDVRGFSGTTGLQYTVSNGSGVATGEISVISIPAPEKLLPPRAEPDTAIVRAGDVVSIAVLANDMDPNGEVLKAPEVVEAPGQDSGKLFADQNQLRFMAGPAAKTVHGVYKVANSTGQFDSAQVTITIVAQDPEHNQPPAPRDLTGRVIAGDKVKIPVPLNGVDPEGDSVELVGIAQAPALGTAQIGNGYIHYTAAGSSAGTDSFSYRVRDRLGAEATARVSVGIAPPLNVNHPPVTSDDFITMRPGRKVALDVVLNDSDPDGGQLALVDGGFSGPASMAPEITATGQVVVTSPGESGTFTMMYTVMDNKGAAATGNIRMTASPDAPLRAPIARDDRVTVAQALGKNTLDVPVMENDEDPDGVTENLDISLEGLPGQPMPNATVNSNKTVRVALAEEAQIIPYTVTDQDGQKATAVIWVPGLGMQYPVLAEHEDIRVTAGEQAVMRLADYVKVRPGRTPRLTEAGKITLLGASRENVIVGDGAGINYAAELSFFGPGSITFEVTDGKGPDDPAGLKSTLTVMTLVDPAPAGDKGRENTPPTFMGTTIEVPQVETVTQDVLPLAFDVDPGDKEKFKFALVSDSPAGFDVKLGGSVLTIVQAEGTRVGQQGTIQLSVADGSNPPVVAGVLLRATSSSKPLAVANDDIVEDAHAGRPETVRVLLNDVNPFPDTPLRIVSAQVETGGAGISATAGTDSVTVTSGEDYKGTVVVKYVVEDKTKDLARTATGRIKMTVKGRPDTPAKPQVLEEKDKSVLLAWDSPADNGSAITHYTVTWAGGSQKCDSNTCTITGLKNVQPYNFSVAASNAVGTSEPSRESAVATPDRIPDTPAAPRAAFGDREIKVSWDTPTGEFSAVTSFNVEISPAPAGHSGYMANVVGNSLTWPGLANGDSYEFRIQAVNKAPNPSEWSQYSVAETPAGVPSAPGAPKVAAAAPSGSNTQVQVTWGSPFDNGAEINGYVLEVSGGGQPVREIQAAAGPAGGSQSVSVSHSTVSYTFRVKASNKAGTGSYGPYSAPQRAVGKLGTMPAPRINVTDTAAAGGRVVVSHDGLGDGQLNGHLRSEIQYCVQLSTGARQCGSGTSFTLASANGVNVYANAWAEAVSGAATARGDNSGPSATVKPYGVPRTVDVRGATAPQGDINWRWTWTAPDNYGSPVTHYMVKVNSGGWTKTSALSHSQAAGGFGQSGTLYVQACNAGGCGTAGSAGATAGAPASWSPSVNPNVVERTCTEPTASSNSYHETLRTCGGVGGNNPPYFYADQNIVVKCYINRGDRVGGYGPWFRVEAGSSRNVGRYVHAVHTYLGGAPGGMPLC